MTSRHRQGNAMSKSRNLRSCLKSTSHIVCRRVFNDFDGNCRPTTAVIVCRLRPSVLMASRAVAAPSAAPADNAPGHMPTRGANSPTRATLHLTCGNGDAAAADDDVNKQSATAWRVKTASKSPFECHSYERGTPCAGGSAPISRGHLAVVRFVSYLVNHRRRPRGDAKICQPICSAAP